MPKANKLPSLSLKMCMCRLLYSLSLSLYAISISMAFMFFFFLLHFLSPLTLSLNQEGLTLFSFKSSIDQDPSSSLSNWNSSDPTPCSWNGITCSSRDAVVSISLPKHSLHGPLPLPLLLSHLPSLRHLNLRSNRLRGPLPSPLPPSPSLQSLVLFGNALSGPIPSSISNLPNLQSLDLSHNSFNGSLPISLPTFKKLKFLDLSYNSFTGSLPAGFGINLTQLQKLDLSHNSLSGLIPGDIGNLSNLQGTADFSHNFFSGSVPASLGNLPEKVYIDLSYNNLSGPIPQNGALENRGPTAFVGNPLLCGPLLKNPCSSSGAPVAIAPPPSVPESSSSKGLSRIAVVAIVACDAVGICLIALVFFYCYRRVVNRENSDKGSKGRKECLCFTKEESDTLSDNAEHLDLIPLDRQVGFDMDELLKASAFVLGKSGIGIVYKVVLEDGLTLAVRRLGEGGSQRFKEFQTEVEAIGRVRHPNIVRLRAYYWSIDEKLLIYDYIPNGNLSSAIHGRANSTSFQPLPWEVRLKIMRGIAKGLAFLHEVSPKKYVHGDLNPSNILLGSKLDPYISDFGLGHLANIAGASPLLQSNRIPSEKDHTQQQSEASTSPIVAAASCYQAPEALKTLKPSQKWDVYSYGVILLELISGMSPVVLLETSDMDLVRWIQLRIEEKKPLADVLDPFLAQELDDEEDAIVAVLKIALACVQAGPERRPTMRHVVETLRC